MNVELVVRDPSGQTHTQALRLGERLVLGRGADAGLRLHDLEASRLHLALELTPGGVVATDLGSGNGTLHGAARLVPNQPQRLTLPARLQVGTHTIVVHAAGTQAAGPAPERRLRDEYEHEATLGRGAHGTVTVAVHRASGRRVAVKAFHAGGLSPTIRARFLREGKIRLESPHIAAVHDVREEGGNLFIIMELVPGQSADDLLAAGPLPLAQALRIAADVTRGLAVAHQQGVVHRDLKPANIIVTPDGGAKIVDFGIAKMKGAALTATGQGIGTLAYVAPEQAADAKRVDPSADLYSLGATLYHFLAGRPPFDVKHPAFMEHLFEDDPPRLTTLRPDCPPPVARLVHRLLEKDPQDRGSNARALLRQLEKLLPPTA